MLSAPQQRQVRELLADMRSDVQLVFFTQTLDCDSCVDTGRILAALRDASPRIEIVERNLLLDTDDAARYGITHAPGIVVLEKTADGETADHRIRLMGAPFGYDFTSLLDAILIASKAAPTLSDASLARLSQVTSPVRIQVFTTPT